MMHAQMWQKMFTVRIHREAWFFVWWSLAVSLVLLLSPMSWLGWLGLGFTVAIMLFFRNPTRITLNKKGIVVSPADGMIVEITDQNPPDELELSDQSWTKIGIFLSPFDVHINRIPCQGIIQKRTYKPGGFAHVVAAQTRTENERLSLVIQTPSDHTLVCTQIAGFMARRILCHVQEKDKVSTGHEYGLICFGSRVDLYVPQEMELFVQLGQHMRGGETLIGLIPENPPSPSPIVIEA